MSPGPISSDGTRDPPTWAPPLVAVPLVPKGCICPPGANKDCEAADCPRRGVPVRTR